MLIIKDRYNKNLGDFGEDTAKNFLIKSGYCIKAQNYLFSHYGEIDIIAIMPDENVLVFVEVKTRTSKLRGTAAESVNHKKIKRMVKTATQYLLENPTNSDLRFDVIEVYCNVNGDNIYTSEINHIKNAFPDLSMYL